MQKRTAILSIMLIVGALIAGYFTVPAMAAGVTETAQSDAVTVLREDESLRGEYEKHFLMSDGTYQATVYNEPVHKLENGAWVEVDNTLLLQSSGWPNRCYLCRELLGSTCNYAKGWAQPVLGCDGGVG